MDPPMDGASLVSPADGSDIVCGKLCPVRFVGDGDWTGVSEIPFVDVERLISPVMSLSCGSPRPLPMRRLEFSSDCPPYGFPCATAVFVFFITFSTFAFRFSTRGQNAKMQRKSFHDEKVLSRLA